MGNTESVASNRSSQRKSRYKYLAYKITEVLDNTPGQRAGLNENDYILKINGRKLTQLKEHKILNFVKTSGKSFRLLVFNPLEGKQREVLLTANESYDKSKGIVGVKIQKRILELHEGLLKFDGIYRDSCSTPLTISTPSFFTTSSSPVPPSSSTSSPSSPPPPESPSRYSITEATLMNQPPQSIPRSVFVSHGELSRKISMRDSQSSRRDSSPEFMSKLSPLTEISCSSSSQSPGGPNVSLSPFSPPSTAYSPSLSPYTPPLTSSPPPQPRQIRYSFQFKESPLQIQSDLVIKEEDMKKITEEGESESEDSFFDDKCLVTESDSDVDHNNYSSNKNSYNLKNESIKEVDENNEEDDGFDTENDSYVELISRQAKRKKEVLSKMYPEYAQSLKFERESIRENSSDSELPDMGSDSFSDSEPIDFSKRDLPPIPKTAKRRGLRIAQE